MDHDLNELRRALDNGGLLKGIAYLNSRVAHRFTAIYQFYDSAMNVQVMFDKQHEAVPNPFARVPIANSLCEMAMDAGHFVAENAIADARLDGNPYQTVLGSYVGLPLERTPGDLYGTLCHYDLVGRNIPDAEFDFLRRAARLIPSYL